MEVEDCAFPLLDGIAATDDPNAAFDGADIAILVGARPRSAGMERGDLLEANAAIFSAGGGLHWVDLAALILGALYYTVGVAVWSTTVGKRALGLYVLRPDGAKAGFGRALARYFAGILSMLLVGIGYLMIGFRSDKRGLHDLICDTVVARK